MDFEISGKLPIGSSFSTQEVKPVFQYIESQIEKYGDRKALVSEEFFIYITIHKDFKYTYYLLGTNYTLNLDEMTKHVVVYLQEINF